MILLALWAASATIFAFASAATNFTVKTPHISDLIAGPSDLRVEEVSFSFDLYTNRYTNATLTVKNFDNSMSHVGSIHIVLYDVGNTEIAAGTGGTGTISPGVRIGSIVVQLDWFSTYTAIDFARGTITLTQTS